MTLKKKQLVRIKKKKKRKGRRSDQLPMALDWTGNSLALAT